MTLYFSVIQIPELSGISRQEQESIVNATLASFGAWICIRMIVMFVACAVLPLMLAIRLSDSGAISHWVGAGVAMTGGIFFFAYLLWEINGPMRRAVRTFLSDSPPQKPMASYFFKAFSAVIAISLVVLWWSLIIAGWILLTVLVAIFTFWLVSGLLSAITRR